MNNHIGKEHPCKVKPVGSTSLIECLESNPLCNFALHFGYGVYCVHPDKEQIVREYNVYQASKALEFKSK